MHLYFEPVNLLQWNLFQKVKDIGHVECFLATKSMNIGDIVLLHVGKHDRKYESGIYAYGKIIRAPYILHNSPKDYCNEKLSVDVQISDISFNEPMIHEDMCKKIFHQFRRVHRIDETASTQIRAILKL